MNNSIGQWVPSGGAGVRWQVWRLPSTSQPLRAPCHNTATRPQPAHTGQKGGRCQDRRDCLAILRLLTEKEPAPITKRREENMMPR